MCLPTIKRHARPCEPRVLGGGRELLPQRLGAPSARNVRDDGVPEGLREPFVFEIVDAVKRLEVSRPQQLRCDQVKILDEKGGQPIHGLVQSHLQYSVGGVSNSLLMLY